jgi:hypothetical protein
MSLLNEAPGDALVDFSLQVLLPDHDPPGPPPEWVILGAQFLTHYNMHVLLDYSAIHYTSDPVSGLRQLDSQARCGHLEFD